MYLNNLFIFSQVENIFFILPAVKNKLFFFVCIKDKTIFLALIEGEATGHAMSFDDNMSNSVGSLVM